MPTFSTHVLDVATGQPAPGVEVTLSPIRDSSDSPTFRALTDSNGRITDGLGGVLDAGVWRATFALGPYFSQRAMPGCIVSVEVTLLLNEERHYHVPLLATPNSATSYLGT